MENLNFADDLALLSTSRRNLQHKPNELEVHAKRTGLHINTAKTKVMKIKTDDNQSIVIGIDLSRLSYGCRQRINSRYKCTLKESVCSLL